MRYARHGHRGIEPTDRTPTYNSWRKARERVYNPNAAGFKYYGGRGVEMCNRWDSFENFLFDMGERPADTTIDRINPFGNYEPDNCRWSTRQVQANNKRRAKKEVGDDPIYRKGHADGVREVLDYVDRFAA